MNTLVMHVSINPHKLAATNSLSFAGGALIRRRVAAAAGTRRSCSLQCMSKYIPHMPTTRRSANYKPPFWDFNYIQSLSSEYNEERYLARIGELILQVKMLLQQEMEEGLPRLELIDDLQRLDVSRHFHQEIDQILNLELGYYEMNHRDLYSTALGFRLLRQHGFRVSQEVFDCFMNEEGDFKADLVDDMRGLLQLYEASFLLIEGEEIMQASQFIKWRYLCGSFMQEARWHAHNGWISSSVPTILSHAFFLIANPVDYEAIQSFYKYHDIVRFPAMVLRLANDLATSPNEIERGDVAESVECYVKETGASREEAQEHVKWMICEIWKKMNEERVGDSEFSREFIRSAVDLARMAQYMYQLGDGHGIQNPQIKDWISSLLFESVV